MMPKKGLCDTAKRLMREFTDSKATGEMFTIADLVKHVSDGHKQIAMTTHSAARWCSLQHDLESVEPCIWRKIVPKHTCRRCKAHSSCFWHPMTYGGEPFEFCDICMREFYQWVEGKV